MERSVGKVFAFAGCLLLGVGLKERSGLIHSVGRYGPVRLRAWTLRDSGRVPLCSQTSVPGPPTHFPASQEEASSLHPGGPCPESHRRWVLAGVRDEGKVVVGERGGRKLDDARGPLGAAASRGCGSRIVKL